MAWHVSVLACVVCYSVCGCCCRVVCVPIAAVWQWQWQQQQLVHVWEKWLQPTQHYYYYLAQTHTARLCYIGG